MPTWHTLMWLVLMGECEPGERTLLTDCLKRYEALRLGQEALLQRRMKMIVAKYLRPVEYVDTTGEPTIQRVTLELLEELF